MNQFEGLCWTLVLPPIRVALSTWDPRDYRAAIAMVLEWQPVLPDCILGLGLNLIGSPAFHAVNAAPWHPFLIVSPCFFPSFFAC